jgi:hypothetical protein
MTLILMVLPSIALAQPSDSWLIMDGPNPGYIEVPHDPALNPENITVEAWVNLTTGLTYTGGCWNNFVGKSYNDAWNLSSCNGYVYFWTHGSSSSYYGTTSPIPIGEWTHVAATYDGSDVKLYINGSLDRETAINRGPLPVSTRPLRIGSDAAWDARPHAAIDEVRIWNVARTEAEIAGMMNTPISSAMAGLVAVWNLDGGPTATVGGFGGANVGDTVYGNTLPEPNPCIREYFLTSAAHSDGALGSKWFTDVTIFNLESESAPVTVFLLPENTDNSNPVGVDLTVEGYTSIAVNDVVLDQFGEADMSAALRICSDRVLLIDGRTYNAPSKAGATFGQGVTGQDKYAAVSWTRRMIGLYENDQFRTNIGMLNTSPEATTVTVRMYTQDRVWLGDKEYELAPYGYKQRSRIFTRVTNDAVENGYIEVWSSGSPILVFATVVDNLSGDGTYKLAR